MKNILIIGSGLTGATLAYLHRHNGDNVTIFEKRFHIGGNVFTVNIEGICVHRYGAHIFHTDDKEVWDFINQFGEFNDYRHIVKTRYNGKVYSLPINMNTIQEMFDITSPEYVTQEHIDAIYERLFYGYSSKQWGKPIENINKEVFKRIPVRKTYNNEYFNDIYQGIPKDGYTSLVEKMLDDIDVKLYVCANSNYDYSKYDIVYNTSTIDKFMDYKLGRLEYRSLKFVDIFMTNKTYQDYAVINEANVSVPYTRIIEHKHFSNKNARNTFITREYPVDYNGHNEPYYTVNNEENNNLHKCYLEIAKKEFPNMIFCGRLGAYRYYDMDDAIKEAMILFKQNN